MLNYNKRVAQIAEVKQSVNKPLVVALMKPD